MITTEDIDRMNYPEIRDRVIEDRGFNANTGYVDWTLLADIYLSIKSVVVNALRRFKRHIMDWLFIGVYFL